MSDYSVIEIFLVLGVLFAASVLIIAGWVSPHRPKPEKLTTYECGERPVGQAWSQFNVRYYIFALMFVVFDVETVFIFPWAVRAHWFRSLELGLFVLIEMIVFVVILLLGLVYAWRKGVLTWT